MKYIVVLFLLVSCLGFTGGEKEQLIMLQGKVVGKHFRPPSGGIFGASSQLIVYFKTDDGKYYEIHVEPLYYELEKGDRIKLMCRKGKFYTYLRGNTKVIEDVTLVEWEKIDLL